MPSGHTKIILSLKLELLILIRSSMILTGSEYALNLSRPILEPITLTLKS